MLFFFYVGEENATVMQRMPSVLGKRLISASDAASTNVDAKFTWQNNEVENEEPALKRAAHIRA